VRVLRHFTYYEIVGDDGLTQYQRDLCNDHYSVRRQMEIGNKVRVTSNKLPNSNDDIYINKTGVISDLDEPFGTADDLDVEVTFDWIGDDPLMHNPCWFRLDELEVVQSGD
jgi:hypothetical protein